MELRNRKSSRMEALAIHLVYGFESLSSSRFAFSPLTHIPILGASLVSVGMVMVLSDAMSRISRKYHARSFLNFAKAFGLKTMSLVNGRPRKDF